MKDGDYSDELTLYAVNDSIRKAGWQKPADIPASEAVSQRI